MRKSARWSRILCLAGTILMLAGCVDPLEGSLLILPGSGVAALGALLGGSRNIRWSLWGLAATAVGVGILFLLSAQGGVSGATGRSTWWLLILFPYPAGAVLSLVAGVRTAVEMGRRLREAQPGGSR
jgi:hypothetical protein